MSTDQKKHRGNWLKFSLALFLCLLARLVPLRAPNVEPILATMMPFGRAYGPLVGFSFAVLSILLYDMATGTLGVQTFFTAGAYGLLGLWAGHYFKKREKKKGDKMNYVTFAILGTLLFDGLTGFTVGPIFYHQSFWGSVVGQIPFTALHLVSNVAFALTLSPAIYHLLDKKRQTESENQFSPAINNLHPKTT